MISIVGYGNMGSSIASYCEKKSLEYQYFNSQNLVSLEKLANSKIVIDSSLGSVFLSNLDTYLLAKQKIIVVASNWYDSLEDVRLKVKAKQGTLFYSQNFAIGNFNYKKIIQFAMEIFAKYPEFDPSLYEEHHTKKKDYPSAVAKEIAKIVLENSTTKTSYQPDQVQGPVLDNTFYSVSLRRGKNTINHTFYLTGDHEDIEITHRVRNRDCFTEGIMKALNFIQNCPSGIYNMQDLMA